MYLHVLLFYTQTVWLMEILEMVLPEEHVRNFTCVKPMGDVKDFQVHLKKAYEWQHFLLEIILP